MGAYEDHGTDKSCKDRQFVTALARGLKVLRCFSHDRPQLSSSDIARLTGLPQPTVWRLCHTLLVEGYLICADGAGKMSIGLPALALGFSALARQPLADIALPRMRAFTERTRLGMSLSIRDGSEMVYLQRTHGDFTYINDPVGARRPFARAPTAWACYGLYDDGERAEVDRLLQDQDPSRWPAVQEHLQGARQQYNSLGFIISIGILHGQLNAVAVPIKSLNSAKVFGLSASGIAAEWPEHRLREVGAELVSLASALAAVQT